MKRVTEHQSAVVRGDELLAVHRQMDSASAFSPMLEQTTRAIADLLQFAAAEHPEVPIMQLAWEAAGGALCELTEHEREIQR